MYNSGNSSKNVTGASVVDGTVEAVDLATAVNNDIADGVAGKATADLALPKAGGTMTGTIAGFTSTGIDDNATSTAITIDASENLAISGDVVIGAGASSKLSVSSVYASAYAVPTSTASYTPYSHELAIENTQSSTTGSFTGIFFNAGDQGAGSQTSAGRISAIKTAAFAMDLAVTLRDSSGGVAETVRFPSSGGITFNGDTAAANALDDYEEGTWTPTVRFSGNSVGVAGTLEGTYVKIGRAVTLSCSITLTSKGSSTGGVTIGGLPFTSESSNGNQAPAAIGRIINISFADMMHAHNNAASDIIYLQETSNAGTLSNIDNTNFTDTSSLKLNVTYQT
jgi:hypothetical protein